jgi:hypothetical protein
MGFASISMAWYFIRGRKSFTGPPVMPDTDAGIDGEPIGAVLSGDSTTNYEAKSRA